MPQLYQKPTADGWTFNYLPLASSSSSDPSSSSPSPPPAPAAPPPRAPAPTAALPTQPRAPLTLTRNTPPLQQQRAQRPVVWSTARALPGRKLIDEPDEEQVQPKKNEKEHSARGTRLGRQASEEKGKASEDEGWEAGEEDESDPVWCEIYGNDKENDDGGEFDQHAQHNPGPYIPTLLRTKSRTSSKKRGNQQVQSKRASRAGTADPQHAHSRSPSRVASSSHTGTPLRKPKNSPTQNAWESSRRTLELQRIKAQQKVHGTERFSSDGDVPNPTWLEEGLFGRPVLKPGQEIDPDEDAQGGGTQESEEEGGSPGVSLSPRMVFSSERESSGSESGEDDEEERDENDDDEESASASDSSSGSASASDTDTNEPLQEAPFILPYLDDTSEAAQAGEDDFEMPGWDKTAREQAKRNRSEQEAASDLRGYIKRLRQERGEPNLFPPFVHSRRGRMR